MFRVRILRADHDTRESCLYQRIGASARAPASATGFECNVDASAFRRLTTKRFDGGDFSVVLPCSYVPAFSHNYTSLDDGGTYHWVGVCLSPSLLRQFKRTAHESLIFGL